MGSSLTFYLQKFKFFSRKKEGNYLEGMPRKMISYLHSLGFSPEEKAKKKNVSKNSVLSFTRPSLV